MIRHSLFYTDVHPPISDLDESQRGYSSKPSGEGRRGERAALSVCYNEPVIP